MNQLTELREDIANALNEAGIRAVEFNDTKLVPPIAVIIPDDQYIVARPGDQFGELSIGVQVLILGPRATEKVAATAMDELIVNAVVALEDFDIVSVTAPGEATLNNVNYFGSIINIEVQIKLRKEVK